LAIERSKGGGKEMRKMLLTLIIACMVVLLSTLSMTAISSAKSVTPLKCELYFALNWDWVATGVGPTWIGTVQGDITGNIYFYAVGATYPGVVEHFAETWLIETGAGSIWGLDDGVWSFKTYEFKSNGQVTGATGDLTDSVGCYLHIRGVSTAFPVPFGTPVTATGTLLISGPD